MSSALTQVEIKSISDNRSISYVFLACYVAFAYDVLLSLPKEIALIWRSRWSLIKFLFFATQYPLLLELLLVIYYTLSPKLPHRFCVTTSYILLWDFCFPFFPSQALFVQRTYAIWDRNRWVLTILSSVAMIWNILIIQAAVRNSMGSAISPPQQPGDFGCSIFHTGQNLYRLLPAFILGAVFDSLVLGLTLVQVLHFARSKSTPVLEILYRDGILYYVILCGSGIAFVVLLVALPTAHKNVVGAFAFFIRTITGTFVSRIILNLRSIPSSHSSSTKDTQSSSENAKTTEIQFAMSTFPSTLTITTQTTTSRNV